MVGFVDDVALVTVNHTTEGVERVTNHAVHQVEEWLRNHELELAHHKTEAVVLTRKWAFRKPQFFSGGI